MMAVLNNWTECQQCSQVQLLNACKCLWKNFRLINTKCLFVSFFMNKEHYRKINMIGENKEMNLNSLQQ